MRNASICKNVSYQVLDLEVCESKFWKFDRLGQEKCLFARSEAKLPTVVCRQSMGRLKINHLSDQTSFHWVEWDIQANSICAGFLAHWYFITSGITLVLGSGLNIWDDSCSVIVKTAPRLHQHGQESSNLGAFSFKRMWGKKRLKFLACQFSTCLTSWSLIYQLPLMFHKHLAS